MSLEEKDIKDIDEEKITPEEQYRRYLKGQRKKKPWVKVSTAILRFVKIALYLLTLVPAYLHINWGDLSAVLTVLLLTVALICAVRRCFQSELLYRLKLTCAITGYLEICAFMLLIPFCQEAKYDAIMTMWWVLTAETLISIYGSLESWKIAFVLVAVTQVFRILLPYL